MHSPPALHPRAASRSPQNPSPCPARNTQTTCAAFARMECKCCTVVKTESVRVRALSPRLRRSKSCSARSSASRTTKARGHAAQTAFAEAAQMRTRSLDTPSTPTPVLHAKVACRLFCRSSLLIARCAHEAAPSFYMCQHVPTRARWREARAPDRLPPRHRRQPLRLPQPLAGRDEGAADSEDISETVHASRTRRAKSTPEDIGGRIRPGTACAHAAPPDVTK